MNRLDRRLTLLKAKRGCVFDPDQYWLEKADRARVARRVRTKLRRMEPVVLLTPRWSNPRRFLDDVATDLLIGSPDVRCRTLDCAGLKGLTNHQAWAWFVEALVELSGLHMEGPAWQAVSRLGFQHVVSQALFAIQESEIRRCLMMHGLQHVPLDALEDLIMAYETYVDSLDEGVDPMFTVVLSGSVTSDEIQVAGSGPAVVLDDFSADEAVEALVEDMGPIERHRLESVIELVGGVPLVLELIADQGEQALSQIVAQPEALWKLLGPLTTEIRGAFEIVASDDSMASRVEELAKEGPLPENIAVDPILVLAGIANRIRQRDGLKVQVRAPAFADMALSD